MGPRLAPCSQAAGEASVSPGRFSEAQRSPAYFRFPCLLVTILRNGEISQEG